MTRALVFVLLLEGTAAWAAWSVGVLEATSAVVVTYTVRQ